MELSSKTFDEFRDLIYEKSGITLGDGKESLVSSRLGKRIRSLGLEDFEGYMDWVKGEGGEEEIVQLLDVISTNVTSFFRESKHFDFVSAAMRRWLGAGQRRFRLWSAASSTGEEPYTLAMTLKECAPGADCDIRLLATDISTRVLEAARSGAYPETKMNGIPPAFVSKYFLRSDGPEGRFYTAREELKSLIHYRRLNLAFPPFPMKGPMDIILCRNVMIYFDNEVKKRLIGEFFRLLKPGGYLLVGHAESLNGIAGGFKTIQPSVYEKPGK